MTSLTRGDNEHREQHNVSNYITVVYLGLYSILINRHVLKYLFTHFRKPPNRHLLLSFLSNPIYLTYTLQSAFKAVSDDIVLVIPIWSYICCTCRTIAMVHVYWTQRRENYIQLYVIGIPDRGSTDRGSTDLQTVDLQTVDLTCDLPHTDWTLWPFGYQSG